MNDQHTVTPKPARQGSIDGFQATCRRCGMVLTHIFESALTRDLGRHLDYHDHEDGRACGEDILCPDDIIRPCVRPASHDGWHDGGVR